MLKAVRFDEKEHKEILDYISSFKDHRGKRNESEAMRFLMKKGLESLQQSTNIQYENQHIDIESIKADLFNQIMEALSNQNAQIVSEKTITSEVIEKEKSTQQEVEKTIEPELDLSNPLLANIINNINR